MQKATPLLLVLVLAGTATFLSFRPLPAKPVDSTTPPAAEKPAGEKKDAPPAPAAAPGSPPAAPATATPEASSSDAGAGSKGTPKPWPQSSSDIPADTGAVFGTLPNGMRYIVYPNTEPPKRVSFRLHIAAGSLMEADDQQGVAHFLEHMVFNGSKDYSAEDLIPKMQRLGIAFGAHANAYTSFDETVYMLDLPDLSDDTLNLGYTVMRDFGDGALLETKEIDSERGVILSEKTSRDSVSLRLMEQQFDKLLPGSLVAKRFPIGTEEVIKGAPRERFTDFYTRYYTPERMTFVVVGDIDPAVTAKRIETVFGSMKNPQAPGKNPDLGKIKSPEGIEASVFADKEVASTEVSLTLIRPFEMKPDTTANRLERLPLDLAHSIISRRFQRITQQEKSPISEGSASRSDLFNYAELGSIDVTAADDRWQDAVPVVEQEFRRAIQFGFTQAELSEAKANVLNAYEQAVKQKPTRKSETLASGIARTLNDDKVFSTPETNLAIAAKGLESIDLAKIHEAFKTFWTASGYHLILTTKDKPEGAEKTLAALYQESAGKAVEAPAIRATEVFGYTNFGRAGTIATRKEVADLGVTQLVLSNKVRVNLKPTDFEKNRIRLMARVGSGKLTQPKGTPMLDAFATAVYEGGGLGKHSNDDLQRILAGRNVSSALAIDEDAFVLAGSTTPTDFQLELQLLTASLTDPGYRTEGLWQFQKAIPEIYQSLKHTTAGPEQELNAWLHGNDSRYAVAPVEKLSGYTIADAKKWLTPELKTGYLELTIVGDFQIDAILPDLLATFGALPARADKPAALESARAIQFPNAPASKSFTFESKIPQAIATAVWKTEGVRDNQKKFRRFNMLAEIYQNRLREEIREKLGASYSPDAGATGSDALIGFGYLMGQSVGKPEDTELLLKTMIELANELSQKGATADELDRALKPTLGMLDKSLRDNSYWLSTVLSESQADPKRLDLARTRESDYRSITLAEINVLAKKFFAAENALKISIKPATTP